MINYGHEGAVEIDVIPELPEPPTASPQGDGDPRSQDDAEAERENDIRDARRLMGIDR